MMGWRKRSFKAGRGTIISPVRAMPIHALLDADPDHFRVPNRGSGNPTPLGGWDCSASKVKWLDGRVQAGQPYCLGLQVPPPVSRAEQYLKGRSFHKLLSEFGSLRKRYWGQHLWGRGYWVASSGNVTDEVWVEYIKNQKPPEPDDNFNVT